MTFRSHLMDIKQAVTLIEKGVPDDSHAWADIGAGTGTFTLALRELLPRARIIALDKSPHALYQLHREHPFFEIAEGDFTKAMDLPLLDGILMANALHYVPDPIPVLHHILQYLKTGGTFILVEYDIATAIPTWVPYPISRKGFLELAPACGLSEVKELGVQRSVYGNGYIYAVSAVKTMDYKE